MRRKVLLLVLVSIIGVVCISFGAVVQNAADTDRTVLSPYAGPVPERVMRQIYEDVKTPYKYGIVLRGENGQAVDCPSVFQYQKKWYMVYICMNEVGYETHLAVSDDLLAWKPLGKLLSFREDTWDQKQVGGYVALQDTTWGGSCTLKRFENKYWMSYIGGALEGYETDPLSVGISWTEQDPGTAHEWQRFPEAVLSREQPDARDFERVTLYKSNVIYDKDETLGHPFVMYYNGKIKSGYEKIGMAVSNDMIHWSRYGQDAIVANGLDKQHGISGDPQVVRIGDVWVMFYFGAFWKPKAFDTFACSYDLVNWTKWEGPHLVEPSEPWDQEYAHKPWVIKHHDIVYHFYNAVGDQGRAIALATSKDLQKSKTD